MKKVICIFLAALMLLGVLSGCGGSEKISGTITSTEKPADTGSADGWVDASSEDGWNDAPVEQPQSTEATEADEATETPLSLGRKEGGVYTNSYAGFGCTLDDTWVFYGAEELQQLPGAVKDLLEGSEMAEALEGVDQITDMMAENTQLLASMNLLYQKQDLQTRLAASTVSEADFVDGVLTQKDAMIAAYTQMGITVDSMERAQVEFLGEDRWAIRTVGSNQGVPLYMVQLFDFTRGSYALTLTISTFAQDNTDQVLALYYPVE